ncbi:MAG: hypothetical protein JWQ72_342, partial [Polaromonas sp.]|nr:hypothetical protein [Polaromonas sp.]
MSCFAGSGVAPAGRWMPAGPVLAALSALAMLAACSPSPPLSGMAPEPALGTSVGAVAAPSAGREVPRLASFPGKGVSKDAKFIADWVADSRDNQGMSFVIIDKKNASLYVFDPAARLLGGTPVLLGAAVGDDSVPGIGDRPIAQVLPSERTTPAGRFKGEPGRNTSGEDVVWVDYDAAVSMHRVRIVDPKQRRLQRLASA